MSLILSIEILQLFSWNVLYLSMQPAPPAPTQKKKKKSEKKEKKLFCSGNVGEIGC